MIATILFILFFVLILVFAIAVQFLIQYALYSFGLTYTIYSIVGILFGGIVTMALLLLLNRYLEGKNL